MTIYTKHAGALLTLAIALTLGVVEHAHAGLLWIGFNRSNSYVQVDATTVNAAGAGVGFSLQEAALGDFDTVTMTPPVGGPIAFTNPPAVNSSGAFFSQGFGYLSQAARDAAFTTGTYTFVATNTSTSTMASASLDYLGDHFPSAVPVFSAATYTSLQGMDASQTFQFNFNSFYGDSFDLGLGLAPSDVATRLLIFKPNPSAPATLAFVSPALASTATNYTINANTLLPGTSYLALLQFTNILHYPGSPVGNFQQFTYTTLAAFQTAAANDVPAPGATLLLALGVIGLRFARRHGKQRFRRQALQLQN